MSGPTPGPVSAKRLDEIARGLSARDHDILRFVSRHAYATTTQLRRLFFAEHATSNAGTRACVRVLGRLHGHGLVARLDRPIGGYQRGSAAYVWHLGAAGERLTRKPDGPRRRYDEPSRPFALHCLAVADAHVTLRELCADGTRSLAAVEIETEAWRSFLSPSGATRVLKPDLFAAVTAEDYTDCWYVEIDRDTESVPDVIAKCRAYAAYRRTGRAQAEHGVFPRVLWVVPDERRAARIRAGIAADRQLTQRLFAVVTADRFAAVIRDPETA